MRPGNEYALGPLDMFPADIAAAADWCNLLFGGWWSWLEKWGKLVSILLGIYYPYVVGCWLLTTLFSLRVLYQEHDFGPNLLWGLGPGQDVFPMRFYHRWRCFKQHFSCHEAYEPTRTPRAPVPHEYLAITEEEVPPLPRRNRAISNIYPSLPTSKSSTYCNDPWTATYTFHDHLVTIEAPAEDMARNAPKRVSLRFADTKLDATPPASNARPSPVAPAAVPPLATLSLIGLPAPWSGGPQRSPNDIFPEGPIEDVMR